MIERPIGRVGLNGLDLAIDVGTDNFQGLVKMESHDLRLHKTYWGAAFSPDDAVRLADALREAAEAARPLYERMLKMYPRRGQDDPAHRP
jgi:hypothetical protein